MIIQCVSCCEVECPEWPWSWFCLLFGLMYQVVCGRSHSCQYSLQTHRHSPPPPHKQIWKATPPARHWSGWHLLCTPTKCPALVTTFEENHTDQWHSHTHTHTWHTHMDRYTRGLWTHSWLYWVWLCNICCFANSTILHSFCENPWETHFFILLPDPALSSDKLEQTAQRLPTVLVKKNNDQRQN